MNIVDRILNRVRRKDGKKHTVCYGCLTILMNKPMLKVMKVKNQIVRSPKPKLISSMTTTIAFRGNYSNSCMYRFAECFFIISFYFA